PARRTLDPPDPDDRGRGRHGRGRSDHGDRSGAPRSAAALRERGVAARRSPRRARESLRGSSRRRAGVGAVDRDADAPGVWQGVGRPCSERLGVRLLRHLRRLARAGREPRPRRHTVFALWRLRQQLADRSAALSVLWRRRLRQARLARVGAHARATSCRCVRWLPSLRQDGHDARTGPAARGRARRFAHAGPRRGGARARLLPPRALASRRRGQGRDRGAAAPRSAASTIVAMLRPALVCRALLGALDASEGRRRRRKRDTTPDAIGIAIKRELLTAAVEANPAPDAFETWLFERCRAGAESASMGAMRAMAHDVIAEWRLAATCRDFGQWLATGARSDDRGCLGPSRPRRIFSEKTPSGNVVPTPHPPKPCSHFSRDTR